MARKSKDKEEVESQISEDQERDEALRVVLKQIEANRAEGTIYRESKEDLRHLPKFSTGIMTLDKMLSGNYEGIPAGRTIELSGVPSCGKSTLALQMAAEVNKRKGNVIYFDLENALSLETAEGLGVDVDSERFTIFHPEDGQTGLEDLEKLVRSNTVDLVVIDSLAAIVPKREAEGGIGVGTHGGAANIISQTLRIITSLFGRPKCRVLLLLINQERVEQTMHGSRIITTGGKAPLFYASVRVKMYIKEMIKNTQGDVTAQIVSLKTIKNKLTVPQQEMDLKFRFVNGFGFDASLALINAACLHGIIDKKTSWYQYGDQKFQGEDNLLAWLKTENKLEEIKQKFIELSSPVKPEK